MNCKKCEAELAEGVNICPNCGAAQNEPEVEEALTEVLAEEPIAEEAPAVEETPVKTGLGAGKIALLVTLAVAAVAVVIALIVGGAGGKDTPETTAPAASGEPLQTLPAATVPADGNPDDVTCKGTYVVSDEELAAAAETVVATMGDAKLTNSELQVYYWMQIVDFMNQHGSYAAMYGLDFSQPLDTQMSIEGTMTWQQFFLDRALENWRSYQAMCHSAREAGFVLDEQYVTYLEDQPASLAASAASMGYESADAMIQEEIGAGVSADDYIRYLENYYLGYMYYGDMLESLEITDADVEAYFDTHAEEYRENGLEKSDETYVDVRHILIAPEGGTADETGATVYSDEEWAAAEAKANEILNEWLTKNPTEDGFSVLAQAHSVDGGSASNGGLYEDVYKGQMVEPFENWCFDASRKVGDYGIVKTNYGYHIMYFVGSELVWRLVAEQDMIIEKGNEFVEETLAKYPTEIDYSAIKLSHVNLAEEG